MLLSVVVRGGGIALGWRSPLLLPVWIIAILAIGTACFAVDRYDAWLGAARWFLMLMLVLAVYNFVKRYGQVNRLLFYVAIGGGYMALVGVLQYLFGTEIYLTSAGYPWPGSTSGHKNQAASFVIFALPITVYMVRTSQVAWQAWLFKSILAMMAALLVYALARQSFVAMLLELVALTLVFRFVCPGLFEKVSLPAKHSQLSTLFASILFLVLIAMPSYDKPFKLENNAVNRLLVKSQKHYRMGVSLEAASKDRFKTWSTTLAMLPDTWYGVGALNWQVYYPKYNSASDRDYNLGRRIYWRFTHNDYLQTLVEFGVLSIFAGILLLYGLFWVCRLAFFNGSDQERYRVFSIAVSMLGLFAIMCFSFPLSMTIQPAYLCIFLGILAATAERWHQSKSDVSLSSGKIWAAVLLLMSVAGGYVGYRMAGGWHYAASGEMVHRFIEKDMYDKEKYPDVSLHHDLMRYFVEKSADMDPWHPRLDMMRGGMLAYIAITTESDDEKKNWYIEKSFVYLNKVRKSFPYYAFPDIVESQIYNSLGDVDKEREALKKVLLLASGDIASVKRLSFIYMEDEKFNLAFNVLDDFFARFYDYELLSVYAYVAQHTGRQEESLQRLSELKLERFVNPRTSEKEFGKIQRKLSELTYALTEQVRSRESG